jgi:uncharacterized protein DUF4835
MYKILFIVIAFSFTLNLSAQELNCRIQVVSSQIQGTNKQVFTAMQKAIYEFVNNTKWTNHVFDENERIECNILINLTNQISADEFSGTMSIQASRPIYNTNYNSALLNFQDNNIQFKYIEQEVLEYNTTTHTSNLSSLLSFYVNVIFGLDYDSFSNEGGTEFFQKAEAIVNNAQNAPERGWKAYEDRTNRYWLIENILNDTYSPIRDFYYQYHRLGLDVMSEKTTDGRSSIAGSLELLQQVHRKKPSSFIMQVLFDAKADEIVNIFSEAFPEEKRRVYNILKEVNPANTSKFEKLLK